MTPRFEEISVEEVIARAKAQLRIMNTSEFDDFLEMLIFEGLGSLDNLLQLVKKQCDIEVCSQVAKFPDDFVKLLAVRMSDGQDNGTVVYTDTNFLKNCYVDFSGNKNVFSLNEGFQIVKNFLHFNSDTNISKITIAYLGVNTDEYGRAMIYSKYERALMAYACYMYALAYAEKFNQYIIEEYKNTWKNQRSKIIGENAMFDFQNDKREICNLMTALLIAR